MAEMLFGSGSQMWPAVPVVGFGYSQSAGGNRVPMVSAPAVPSPSVAMSGMSVAPFEFASTVTPQAVLAAVAIRRGQPTAPANDQEMEDFISDALDLLLGANDVDVRCEGGRATLTGSVSQKRVKRDAGEIVWAIPTINDVQNNITIATRRRSRTSTREGETGAGATPARKQG